MSNLVHCPHCNKQFPLSEALTKQLSLDLEAQIRSDYKNRFANFQLEQEQKLDAERLKIREEGQAQLAQLRKQAGEEVVMEMEALKLQLDQKRQENQNYKAKELALLEREQELKEAQANLEMELRKQLLEQRGQLEQELGRKLEDQFLLKIKDKDLMMEQMRKTIEELQRKAEQGSMQLQGESQELALEEMLREKFRNDIFEEVKKGFNGADVIQIVRNGFLQPCGKIIFESKRTKEFSPSWIPKLKDDVKLAKADIAILVTAVLPKEIRHFGYRDGVWICDVQHAEAVTFMLRESLIKLQEVRAAEENKGDKMAMLYQYLTGNEFMQHMSSFVEVFSIMKKDLDKEKRAFQKIWKERERNIERVMDNAISIYGSVKGIAGTAVKDIQELELDHLLDAPLEEDEQQDGDQLS
jgi:hypothetical protein